MCGQTYSAAGQAASALHAMAILQVHQAKALKQVHEGSTDPGLNRALHKLPFKMLTHRRMIKCIQPQDWFAAIDLKDAYFHVSILPRHRPFLRFTFEGRAWQYRVLPFGLSLSARVFTKVVEGALTPLREVGVRILNYLDDWPILAQSREQLGDHRDLVLRHVSQLGLRVNWEKSKLSPVQRISFLGVELDSVSMTARLTEERAQAVLNWLSSFRGRNVVPLKQFQRLLRHMASAAAVTPLLIASYETTSALATLPGPEVGMAPRYTASRYLPAVSPLPQPLDRPCLSTGRGAPRTSVPAYCCHNRCLQHGLGRYMQRAGSLGALDRAPTALAHQLPGAFSLAAVPATAVGQARASPHGQHCGGLVWGVYDHTACHSSPAISSSGVTRRLSHCVLFTSRGSSIVRPTSSHDSSRSPESGDSIPRRSG